MWKLRNIFLTALVISALLISLRGVADAQTNYYSTALGYNYEADNYGGMAGYLEGYYRYLGAPSTARYYWYYYVSSSYNNAYYAYIYNYYGYSSYPSWFAKYAVDYSYYAYLYAYYAQSYGSSWYYSGTDQTINGYYAKLYAYYSNYYLCAANSYTTLASVTINLPM
jgi:hypothetical protein